MTFTKRQWLVIAGVAGIAAGSQLIPATAVANPDPPPPQPGVPAQPDQDLHNVTYRARVDGVSRGTTITYSANDDRIQTAEPTMVPGRTFEAQTVLPASQQANMRVSIDWPYSANLHCEILVDDKLVAQADDFIAPRLLPDRDDPDYGTLRCQAPVSSPNPVAPEPTGTDAGAPAPSPS